MEIQRASELLQTREGILERTIFGEALDVTV
jgi:hypothetical protein